MISHRCLPILAFVWDLTKETINRPLGFLQGGKRGELDILPGRLPESQEQILVLTVLYVLSLLSAAGHADATPLSDRMHKLNGFRKPTPPQNRQLIVYH